MRIRRLVLALVVALMFGALLPTGAQAIVANTRVTSADAWWSTWDWDSGMEPGPTDAITDWNVSGFKLGGVRKDFEAPAEALKKTVGWASMFSYAPATASEPETWMEFTCMAEPPGVLTFGKALSSAELEFLAEGTLNVWRETPPWIEVAPGEMEPRDPDESTTEMVSVMAKWRASGPLTRSSYINRERSADFAWADRMVQSSRPATVEASVVGAGGTIYLQPGMFDLADAAITDYKGGTHFRGMQPF